jgi:hypothetical protein
MLALVPTADAKSNGIRGKALAALLGAPRGLESKSRNPKWAKWAVECEAAAKRTAEAATAQPSVEPLVPTADAKINGIRGKALAALLGAPRGLESQARNPKWAKWVVECEAAAKRAAEEAATAQPSVEPIFPPGVH